ncbi:MAG: MobA/MobL family protein [bacterium]|nr:MobA/MobL family protein [bacterium]
MPPSTETIQALFCYHRAQHRGSVRAQNKNSSKPPKPEGRTYDFCTKSRARRGQPLSNPRTATRPQRCHPSPMAIYHCTTKTFSRSKGQSATAAAAYRAGVELTDTRTGQHHDYTRKRGVVATAIFTPANAPAWNQNRAELWNRAEVAERYKNAVVVREVEVSLPHELKPEQRRALAQQYGQYLSQRYGVAVDMAIHAPHRKGDERNHHVHYLMSTRRMNENGFAEKGELELSDKKKKEMGFQVGKQQVKEIRKNWADHANRALKEAGLEVRLDHRSYKAQGIDRTPTQHMGPTATKLEREGKPSRIGDKNRATETWNRDLYNMQQDAKVIDLAIEREKRRPAEERRIKAAESKAMASNALDLKHLDEKREQEQRHGQRRGLLNDKLDAFYKRKAMEQALQQAKEKAAKAGPFTRKAAYERAETLGANLADAKRREGEQRGGLEKTLQAEKETLLARQKGERGRFEQGIKKPSNDTGQGGAALARAAAIERAEGVRAFKQRYARGGGRSREPEPER